MLMETSDGTLVDLAQSGDEEAFAQLVSRHYDLVFRVAFRMLGRRSDAEDLTQDVFSSLPGKLSSFRGDAKFSAWLSRVTTNLTIDYIRRQSAHSNAMDGWGELERMSRASMSELREELTWTTSVFSRSRPLLNLPTTGYL